MHNGARIALAAAGLALMGPAAVAADYPYSGYFSSQPLATAMDDARLACAFSFIRQDRDGTFVGYHIDKPAFLADRTVRYLEYGAGTCTIDAKGVEACTMTASQDEDEIDRTYYDVAGAIAADTVETASFDSKAQADAFASGHSKRKPAFTSRFVRCPGFDDASLAGAVSGTMSTLPLSERGPLQSPEFTDANRALMRDILGALAAPK